MTPLAIATIRHDFEIIAADADGFAAGYYDRLFVLAPALRPLFKSDPHDQGLKLVSMLGAIARSLDRFDDLVGPIRALGRRHAGYGVRSEDCAVMGQALLDTLQHRLPAFAEEARAAWAEAFVLIADEMMEGAQDAAAA